MGDYEQSRDVNAPAQALFDYLADVRNIPRYFSGMRSAEPAEGGAVHVTADVDGKEQEGEAWFNTLDEVQRLVESGPARLEGRRDCRPDRCCTARSSGPAPRRRPSPSTQPRTYPDLGVGGRT